MYRVSLQVMIVLILHFHQNDNRNTLHMYCIYWFLFTDAYLKGLKLLPLPAQRIKYFLNRENRCQDRRVPLYLAMLCPLVLLSSFIFKSVLEWFDLIRGTISNWLCVSVIVKNEQKKTMEFVRNTTVEELFHGPSKFTAILQ